MAELLKDLSPVFCSHHMLTLSCPSPPLVKIKPMSYLTTVVSQLTIEHMVERGAEGRCRRLSTSGAEIIDIIQEVGSQGQMSKPPLHGGKKQKFCFKKAH
jgi:hypothetical protein